MLLVPRPRCNYVRLQMFGYFNSHFIGKKQISAVANIPARHAHRKMTKLVDARCDKLASIVG